MEGEICIDLFVGIAVVLVSCLLLPHFSLSCSLSDTFSHSSSVLTLDCVGGAGGTAMAPRCFNWPLRSTGSTSAICLTLSLTSWPSTSVSLSSEAARGVVAFAAARSS